MVKNAFSWSKVTLRNGSKYDKVYLLKELLARSSVKFVPICYQVVNNNSVFYVEEQEASRALKDLDKKIELPDGYDLMISVQPTTPPNIPISDELVGKIKLGMSDRYDAEKSALNLNTFHKSFAGESFFAPLWRTNIMSKVVNIILDNIPEVKAIDLSNNRLLNLDALVAFQKLKHLNVLHLKDNKLTDLRGLEKLKGISLINLRLDGNPVKERLGSSYTESVRKIFSSLQELDGKALPKQIGFEDEGSAVNDIPLSCPKLIKNEAAGNLVLQFLEQYFKLYDSDSRQPLLDAYDENAMMSLTAIGAYESMKAYIEESRNLCRVNSDQRKVKLLRRGRLPIVSFLSGLPKTEHDPTSFSLDLPFTSDSLMIFTVTGMFRERETKGKSVRFFNRCFIVVPRGSGFCIINEMLFVSNPTAAKAKKAFNSPDSSMQSFGKPSTSGAAGPAPIAVDEATKQTLTTALAERTGMNLVWATHCLEENLWNFDKASAVFQELKTSGKIPPEAFAKN